MSAKFRSDAVLLIFASTLAIRSDVTLLTFASALATSTLATGGERKEPKKYQALLFHPTKGT
jgi:hypothetical protein